MEELIRRDSGLTALRRWRDQPVIKVVTGVRRCGKSTLLELFRRDLRADGVRDDQIVSLNLESLDDAALASDFRALHDHVVARAAAEGTTYVFIDEVQVVEDFEKAIDSLHLRPGIDLYVTGSNAMMLSGELATRLSGRYVEVPMTPLSFAEYVVGRGSGTELDRLYQDFSRWGSFPFVTRLIPDADAVADYLEGILSTVLVKDVMVRQKVANALMLRDVVTFLMGNVGSPTSLRRVANTLASAGRRPSPNTVENYLTGLVDAYVMYPLYAYDVKGLRRLDTPAKYYAVDPGLRAAVVGHRGGDVGHVLENVVFLELRRRHKNLWSGRSGDGEIDFVVQEGAQLTYYQVAATVRDSATLARELAPLQAIRDHHPKYLLTLDQDPPTSHDGIQQRNALDWLTTDSTRRW
ncbi:MAG: ATP-binding protein [Cellulomonas sp.]|nr:ATP-binding protein [Cellulomonas sp.]